ncbi:AAA family ATPase [Butyrivibrio sp. AC2005]|uniref:AAA family ATPase n=1 Tax=Butyrivibrio sp. AC2005 TaxID=1280672 RepID=UPI0003FFC420|nr:AAA family ATPase [Butyrivibrio sp. AC2005]
MINKELLSKALEAYKQSFSTRWPEEKYKWEAIKWFQEHWDINADNFSEMFWNATEKTINLLTSARNFPRGMIKGYAEKKPEVIRGMFLDLFDETKDTGERIVKFQSEADALCEELSPGKQHFQRPMAISVYLWLMYPDKHDIFKYSVCKKTVQYLESDFVPKMGHTTQNIVGNTQLINELMSALQSDNELVTMYENSLDDNCYHPESLRTLAQDFSFFIAIHLADKPDQDIWHAADYNPGISMDEWIKILGDKTLAYESTLEMLARMKDYGGQATCTQLSTKYGETPNFYNINATSFAKRLIDKTDYVKNYNPEIGRWPVLFIGKDASSDDEGAFIWKLRDELDQALDKIDLSEVRLYADSDEEEVNYWWLNANPKIWSFSDLAVGEEQGYSLYNDNGNKRRVFQNFLDAKEGDLVIGYESTPVKKVVSLAKVSRANDGEQLYFEKTEGLGTPIDYQILHDIPELEKMEYFQSPQGSLFKLTKGEYDLIMDMIRDENPLPENEESLRKYTKEDFISEVYISEERYESLKALLLNKQNIILQGAPGVGKTFAAKRLAYSIMGVMDENRIEFVQFHQNYSYEDFIMGYKPDGEGFELKNGIFYRFCQKAANNPDVPYFFIIDEINRGNMSKIFGELLMLIEKDYRGTKATLAYNGLSFSVPKNLYIIGMMNTADRSLAMIDYALRRRFSFYSVEPGFETEGFRKYLAELNDDTLYALIDVVISLNKAITEDPSLGKGFCIGHSYFCGQKKTDVDELDGWMNSVVEYDIIPMLEEYWFDEPDKIRLWRSRLQGVFNS